MIPFRTIVIIKVYMLWIAHSLPPLVVDAVPAPILAMTSGALKLLEDMSGKLRSLTVEPFLNVMLCIQLI